ncbi:MAG TPA: EamA family transporter [Cyclobacteriaceae bacterium]|nr:EamA family transporter [Cyclobacteriaceae bacterium]
MNNKKYYAAAISAFVVWGFFPWLLKSLSGFGSGEILYFRILFSTIVLLAIVLVFRNSKLQKDLALFKTVTSNDKVKIILLWLAGGLLLTINWLTFIYTVNEVNIRTASFSYLICPVLTAVLGYVILKESITPMQWAAVLLCALSCVIMGLNSVSELGYSFTTALTYGLYLVLQRLYKEYDRMTVLSVQIIFSFVLLNSFQLYEAGGVQRDTHFFILITIIAACFTVLPLFLNLYALVKINSATVGILMYINPLINFTIAFLVFHEEVTMLQVSGYCLIAVALVVFNYPNFRKLQALRSPS